LALAPAGARNACRYCCAFKNIGAKIIFFFISVNKKISGREKYYQELF